MCYVTCTFTADIEIRLDVHKLTCKLNKVNNARILIQWLYQSVYNFFNHNKIKNPQI